jgi:hypothetical protein
MADVGNDRVPGVGEMRDQQMAAIATAQRALGGGKLKPEEAAVSAAFLTSLAVVLKQNSDLFYKIEGVSRHRAMCALAAADSA